MENLTEYTVDITLWVMVLGSKAQVITKAQVINEMLLTLRVPCLEQHV